MMNSEGIKNHYRGKKGKKNEILRAKIAQKSCITLFNLKIEI